MSPTVISSSRVIHAPVSSVLAVLHNPTKLAQLNPLVVSVTQNPEDHDSYTITDKITILGISFPEVYTAKFLFIPDGVDSDVRASAGVRLRNEWRVKAHDDVSEVTETGANNISTSGVHLIR